MDSASDSKRAARTIVWHYEGRDVPIEVRAELPPEAIDAVAEFLWSIRHLADDTNQSRVKKPADGQSDE